MTGVRVVFQPACQFFGSADEPAKKSPVASAFRRIAPIRLKPDSTYEAVFSQALMSGESDSLPATVGSQP
jgi:hypothetical protein